MGSKPVHSTPPWPLHPLLPPGSCPDSGIECDLECPPQVAFGHGVYHSTRELTRTQRGWSDWSASPRYPSASAFPERDDKLFDVGPGD